MTGGQKLLIDTNVLIGLEDPRAVLPEFAQLQKLCSQHGHRLFVHDAALADVGRDRDVTRRRITLSKLEKFERLGGIRLPPLQILAARYGTISKANDEADVALLHALEIGAADFLITQDQGIHARAAKISHDFADRVLTVADAVDWLVSDYEPKSVRLPLVEEVPAHAIDASDNIFESLRDGYPDFDRWWREKCVRQHRTCWIVTIDGELAGLVVRKQESHAEASTVHLGPKILKLCTFKVKPKFRGEKLGELLLKQCLWFSQQNGFDLVYVTTFSDQLALIQMLEYFGFERTGGNDRGEEVYEKPLARTALTAGPRSEIFEKDRLNYPRFVSTPPAMAFSVPIRGEFHDRLFPELADSRQSDLFDYAGLTRPGPRAPGNTIRKVYVCRAPTNQIISGDVLYFYRSQSASSSLSQSMTTVGVVERVTEATALDQLIRLTAKRSVYSAAQLSEMINAGTRPLKVIDFLLVGHLQPPVLLHELLTEHVFNGRPPQSITALPHDRTQALRNRMHFGFQP